IAERQNHTINRGFAANLTRQPTFDCLNLSITFKELKVPAWCHRVVVPFSLRTNCIRCQTAKETLSWVDSAFFSLLLLLIAPATFGQGVTVSLQPGIPIEKSMASGQTHSYILNLEKDQFAQIDVEKHGVEIVLRMFGPDGKLVRESDESNGTD